MGVWLLTVHRQRVSSLFSLSPSRPAGRIANQTGEENDGTGTGGATKRNQLTSGNSIGGTAGGMAAITSAGGGGNGTGLSVGGGAGGAGGGAVGTMGSTGVVSGSGMTPGAGMVVGGGGVVVPGGGGMDDPMAVTAATGTNSSRPYDTPERRSSIRLRGQSVVNDGRNVK